MKPIVTCLWFVDHAEDAAEFYTSLVPNSSIDKVLRAPVEDPNTQVGIVLSVEFTLNGQKYVGLNGGPKFEFNEAISFQLHCETQDEIDKYYDAITQNGAEVNCGWIKDKWGLSWQIIPTRLMALLTDPNPDRSRRTMMAMLKMKKLNIAELEKAANASVFLG